MQQDDGAFRGQPAGWIASDVADPYGLGVNEYIHDMILVAERVVHLVSHCHKGKREYEKVRKVASGTIAPVDAALEGPLVFGFEARGLNSDKTPVRAAEHMHELQPLLAMLIMRIHAR